MVKVTILRSINTHAHIISLLQAWTTYTYTNIYAYVLHKYAHMDMM